MAGRVRWRDLCTLLEGRPGWSVQDSPTPGADPRWCLAPGGEVEAAVELEGGSLSLYVMRTDTTVPFAGVAELGAWLEGHEAELGRAGPDAGDQVTDLLHGHLEHWGEGGPTPT